MVDITSSKHVQMSHSKQEGTKQTTSSSPKCNNNCIIKEEEKKEKEDSHDYLQGKEKGKC
jgi:hypothetical protein